MKIAVTGASGLVGRALCARLEKNGHDVLRLVRRAAGAGEATWSPDDDAVAAVDGCDAVIHLAGENVSGGRWNAARKERIRASRVDGTGAIARGISQAVSKPKVLVSASAIGLYGDRGDEVLEESASAGDGFLADVCRAWEKAAQPARDAGVRVAYVRIGVVLSREGGALKKMLTPFKLGAGGRIGSGKQWMSWIHLDDLVSALVRCVEDDSMSGPVNGVAPAAVTNAEFTRTLGKVLGRPTIFPMPAIAARLAFGEMADALLLSSARVKPSVLEGSGFAFASPTLEEALRSELGR